MRAIVLYLDRYTNCQFIKYGLYHFNLLQMVLHWLLSCGNMVRRTVYMI
jgi:hypothetical protein